MTKAYNLNVLRNLFPELTKMQIEVSALYSLGCTYEVIADIHHISPNTVRSHLRESTKALNVDGHESLRAVFLLRTHIHILERVTK